MSDQEQTSEAPEAPVLHIYYVQLRVVGRVTMYCEAETLDEAQEWAENCDIDPSDIQVSDAEVLRVSLEAGA